MRTSYCQGTGRKAVKAVSSIYSDMEEVSMPGDFSDYSGNLSKSDVGPSAYVLIGPLEAAAIPHLRKSEAMDGSLTGCSMKCHPITSPGAAGGDESRRG